MRRFFILRMSVTERIAKGVCKNEGNIDLNQDILTVILNWKINGNSVIDYNT